ncbi:MAG TPA: selenium metabolism-associated LysR family transcriptional regulator [Armatimonadota bacterium]|nr:selenium metabolism-associated LysR family transcriptional regulator [Armatimonadota bacterium]
MNFQQVKAFCTIVSEGSFSRAAERLHLTQPTISAQIQALEKSMRTRLFERSAQGISLTQAGKVLHPYALQMLELSERTEQALDDLQGLTRGRLEIGASTVPGHYLLPLALARFKSIKPGVEVRLVVSNSQAVRTGVRDGDFELGMVGERVRDERLTYVPVARDQLVVAMRPEHPLAREEALHPADLLGHPLVMREYGSGTRATLERALAESGVNGHDLQVFLEMGSAEAVKLVIRSVDALAVLSEWSVKDEVRLGLLRTVPLAGLDLARDLFLVWRAHGYLSVASEAFVEYLRNEHLRGAADAP